jgi:hypothetical protein
MKRQLSLKSDQAITSQRRFLRLGIVWWELPTAITLAVWLHGARYGFSWSDLLSREFFVLLLVFLLVIGLIGAELRRCSSSSARQNIPLKG